LNSCLPIARFTKLRSYEYLGFKEPSKKGVQM
jgi:hypothetical protein